MTVRFYGDATDTTSLQRPAPAVDGDIIIAAAIACGYHQVGNPTPSYDTVSGWTAVNGFSSTLGPVFLISGVAWQRYGIATVQYKVLAPGDTAWSYPAVIPTGSFDGPGSLPDGTFTATAMTWVVQGASSVSATFESWNDTGSSVGFDATPASASASEVGLSFMHFRGGDVVAQPHDPIRLLSFNATWGPVYSYGAINGISGTPTFTSLTFHGGVKCAILAS